MSLESRVAHEEMDYELAEVDRGVPIRLYTGDKLQRRFYPRTVANCIRGQVSSESCVWINLGLTTNLEVMALGGHNRVSRYRLRPSGPLRLRKM